MLATLLDRTTGPYLPLPAALRTAYGGELGFGLGSPHVVANFVQTLDGVVSYRLPGRSEARLISGGHPADRFLMGLLRAACDAIVVGAGTLREERDHVWTPDRVYPQAAEDYRALREALGKPPLPTLVFVTGRGDLDLRVPTFHVAGLPVVVLTTARGAERLGRQELPRGVRIHVAGEVASLGAAALLETVVAESGARLVLTEGGPTVLGRLVAERRLDELFLTVAPQLAGRDASAPRLALVEGRAFAPERAPWLALRSAKVAGDHLFLRYARTDQASTPTAKTDPRAP